MNKLKRLALYLEGKLYGFLNAQLPVLHTAWQAALGALVAGLIYARSTTDVKAVVMVAATVFLAAVKAAYLNTRG